MRRFALERLREQLQSGAATALGLLVLTLLFVHFVPRQAEIAARFNEGREAAMSDVMNAEADRLLARGNSADAAIPDASAPPVEDRPPETPALPPQTDDTAVASLPPSLPALAPPASRSTLLARPVAVDTATILIRRGRVHLDGVTPVPLNQRCGGGPDAWFCGVEARTQFRAWLRARSITCDVPENFGDALEERSSRCTLAGEDLGRWLVANGWAQASPDGPYAKEEAEARSAGLGVWGPHRPGA